MDARTFMQWLQTDGVFLRLEDGMLHYDAPKGVMTDALLSELRQYKAALIAELSRKNRPEVDADPIPSNDEPKPYIHRCPICDGTRWGCTRTELETLESGETREVETWGCL